MKLRFGNATLACDARDLEISSRRRNLRIESGRRGGDQIDRDRLRRILIVQCGSVCLDALDQLAIRRPEVGASGISGVVADAGCGWTRMEIFRGGERLSDQTGANRFSVAVNNLAVRFVFK